MGVRATVKQNAKKSLSNNWAKAITIFLILVGISIVFSILEGAVNSAMGMNSYFSTYSEASDADISMKSMFVSNIFSILFSLITIPLGVGTVGWYLNLSGGKIGGVAEIFKFFSSKNLFFRTIGLSILIYFRSLGWSILFIGPGTFLMLIGIGMVAMGSESMVLISGFVMLLSIVLLIAGLIAFWVMFNKYFLAQYYIQDENITVKTAIEMSIENTKGFKLDILWLNLSFIGWFMLSCFILPLLYVWPYYNASLACYARYLMEYAERKKGSFADFPLEDEPIFRPEQA